MKDENVTSRAYVYKVNETHWLVISPLGLEIGTITKTTCGNFEFLQATLTTSQTLPDLKAAAEFLLDLDNKGFELKKNAH